MSVSFSPIVLELMASRICHDLISPIGAISNGLELMEDMGDDFLDDSLSLIGSSSEQAAFKLKVFRLAYGAAGAEDGIDPDLMRDSFQGMVEGSRNNLLWADDIKENFWESPKGFMKVILNILVLAEECNPSGGTISVETIDDKSGVNIKIDSNKQTIFHDGAEDALKGNIKDVDLDARNVHAYITSKFAEHYGFNLSYEVIDNTMFFKVLK